MTAPTPDELHDPFHSMLRLLAGAPLSILVAIYQLAVVTPPEIAEVTGYPLDEIFPALNLLEKYHILEHLPIIGVWIINPDIFNLSRSVDGLHVDFSSPRPKNPSRSLNLTLNLS